MSRRRWDMAGVALACVVVAAGLAARLSSATPSQQGDAPGTYLRVFGVGAWAVVFLSMGALLLWHRPSLRLGALLVLNAASVGIGLLLPPDATSDSASGRANVILFLVFGALNAMLLQLFPTDRPLGGRWRWVTRSLVLGTILCALGQAIGVQPQASPLVVPVIVAIVAYAFGMVGSLAMLVARFSRAQGLERAQLKWFMFGVCVALLIWFVPGPATAHLQPLGGVAIVGSMTVAILRYRLYEIDRIVSRTASYAIVTAAVAGTYVAIVLGASRVLGGSSPVVVAAATLTAAAMVRPLLGRVQQTVDRRFDRPKYDGERTVGEFGASLRTVVDPSTVLNDLVAVVHRTVQPQAVAFWTEKRS